MTRVLKEDLRHVSLKICDRVRDKFFIPFGLDWERFKAEGMEADELRGPGQHLEKIDRLEEVAKEREAKNGR